MTAQERDSLDTERLGELRQAQAGLTNHKALRDRYHKQLSAVLEVWPQLAVMNGTQLHGPSVPDPRPLPSEVEIAETFSAIKELTLKVSNLKAELKIQ